METSLAIEVRQLHTLVSLDKEEMSSVVVFGASGYIGRYVAYALRDGMKIY